MKKLIIAGMIAGTIGMTGCANRSDNILKACGPQAKVVAIDDDQVVCENRVGGKQFIREADDD